MSWRRRLERADRKRSQQRCWVIPLCHDLPGSTSQSVSVQLPCRPVQLHVVFDKSTVPCSFVTTRIKICKISVFILGESFPQHTDPPAMNGDMSTVVSRCTSVTCIRRCKQGYFGRPGRDVKVLRIRRDRCPWCCGLIFGTTASGCSQSRRAFYDETGRN